MNARDLFMTLFSLGVWYGFIYYWLYVLKHPVELWSAALILLMVALVGTISCPLVYTSSAYENLCEGE